MSIIKLDLHHIYNQTETIENELNLIIDEALERRIDTVEIVTGKGSGQLKNHVLRFLKQSHIRKLYYRIEKDNKNLGRIFVHFKFDPDEDY